MVKAGAFDKIVLKSQDGNIKTGKMKTTILSKGGCHDGITSC